MLDFEVRRSARRCARTDRELRPGESFYSVLRASGADVLREDYCEEAWDGPPEGVLGWWKSRVPEPDARRLQWAPNDVILDYFERLETQPEKHEVRYLLALLMIRRRLLRLEDTERLDDGREQMVAYCPRNETEYRIDVVSPPDERLAEIQGELVHLLFADAE